MKIERNRKRNESSTNEINGKMTIMAKQWNENRRKCESKKMISAANEMKSMVILKSAKIISMAEI